MARSLPASINGRTDNPLIVAGSCWVVTAETPRLSPHEADLEMLQRAIRRVRGAGSEPGAIVYGMEAMDLWAAQFAKVPFCQIEECYGDGGCARPIKNSVQTGARMVASYLTRRLSSFAEATRPPIEQGDPPLPADRRTSGERPLRGEPGRCRCPAGAWRGGPCVQAGDDCRRRRDGAGPADRRSHSGPGGKLPACQPPHAAGGGAGDLGGGPTTRISQPAR